MNVSNETIEVLKNFAGINPNIVISPGQKLKTISEAKNIMAEADITEDFPVEFGIYDLHEFLSVINLVDTPVLNFGDNSVRITDGRLNVNYFYSEKDILTTPQKDINMPDSEVGVTLTMSQLDQIKKASAVLGHSELIIGSNDEGNMYAQVCDTQDSTSNSFTLDLEVQCPSNFQFLFNIPNLKLMNGDYHVSISSKLISHWTNVDYPINYFIALEKGSSFGV